jgi:phospholipid-transporting ATPase
MPAFTFRSIKEFFVGESVVLPYREFRIWDGSKDQVHYCSNEVITARYTILTFFPVNLFLQLSKPANLYFLLIAILQVIPGISLSGRLPTVAIPLVIVILVNMIKDGIEDYHRHVGDRKENSRHVELVDPSSFAIVLRNWAELSVGDVIVIRNHERAPADVVVLTSSDVHGLVFVETSNLDGESNLKLKSAPREFPWSGTLPTSPSESAKNLSALSSSSLTCQLPNNSLYQFEGSFKSSSSPVAVALSASNLVLRGCTLRNTEWMLGLVVYTGPETKIQMNSAKIPQKISTLERLMGEFTLIVFIVQLVLCLVGALMWGIIASDPTFANKLYLDLFGLEQTEIVGRSIMKYFSYMILFSNFIPISLTVTTSLVKVLQALLIEADESMGNSTVVRSSDLNEDLGQIDYVFSDKTGTLTRNIMEFRKCCVGGVTFGEGLTEIRRNVLRKIGQEAPPDPIGNPNDPVTPNVNFVDHRARGIILDGYTKPAPSGREFENLAWFFFSLAVNHSVMIEHQTSSSPDVSPVSTSSSASSVYSASNPDEGALCYGAKHLGFEFVKRDSKGITVRAPNGDEIFVEQLAMFDFTSTRKRSSLLCRTTGPLGSSNAKVYLLTKGADTVILPRLSTTSRASSLTKKMTAEMDQFSLDGLRTLCVGVRELSDETFVTDWLDRYNSTLSAMESREKKLALLADEIEAELELIGVSAIEDKLQANVGDTIDSLRQAGIKVWMLTGDKMETAVNIGLATSLLNSVGMYQVSITGTDEGGSETEFRELLWRIKSEVEAVCGCGDLLVPPPVEAKGCTEVGLIVDGSGLEMIFKSHEFKLLFAEISAVCSSVICCRVSPEQKGSVVRLIRKTQKKTTLAIGDGANDCNMIQAANIGLGLIGEEGLQAFNVSDYGVKEFQALKPLILVHGRWAYRRIAKLVLYMFYKNVVICLPSYFLNVTTALFSGQLLFNEYLYQLYNVFFTALPVIIYGVLEQDLNKKDCLAHPHLYRVGPYRTHANKRTFAKWMLTGVWHSVCVFYIPYCAMAGTNLVHKDGVPSDLWLFGTVVYMAIMLVVSLKLVLETYFWNGLLVASILVSLGLWGGFLMLIEYLPLLFTPTANDSTDNRINLSPGLAGVPHRLFTSPMTWFILAAAVGTALARDFIFKAFRLKFRPRDYHVIMAATLVPKDDFEEPAATRMFKPLLIVEDTPAASPLLIEESKYF